MRGDIFSTAKYRRIVIAFVIEAPLPLAGIGLARIGKDVRADFWPAYGDGAPKWLGPKPDPKFGPKSDPEFGPKLGPCSKLAKGAEGLP